MSYCQRCADYESVIRNGHFPAPKVARVLVERGTHCEVWPIVAVYHNGDGGVDVVVSDPRRPGPAPPPQGESK